MNRALVSSITTIKDDFIDDHMKLCFLWYDEVLLETLNNYHRQNYVKQIVKKEQLNRNEVQLFTDIVVPIENRVTKHLLQKFNDLFNDLKECGYPRWGKNWENYTYPEPQNAKEYAHNALLSHIQRDWGIGKFEGHMIERAEGRARAAVKSVSLWETVQQVLPCMLQANHDEKIAMTSARVFNTDEDKIVEPFKLFESVVPTLLSVPWKEVLRLKAEGNFDKFREKLNEILNQASGDLIVAQNTLTKLEEEAIAEIVENYRPNVKKIAIESFLANIPGIPIINPASAFFGVRDTMKERRKAEKFSWFYLLRDIKQLRSDG